MRDHGGDGEEGGVCRDWMWKRTKRATQVAKMKMESLGEERGRIEKMVLECCFGWW